MNKYYITILIALAQMIFSFDLQGKPGEMLEDKSFQSMPLNCDSDSIKGMSIYKITDRFFYDDYFNLLRGDSINLNKLPHISISDSDSIQAVVQELLSFSYVGDFKENMPTCGSFIAPLAIIENLQIFTSFSQAPEALIVAEFNDKVSMSLWLLSNGVMIVNGKKFKTPLFDQNEYSLLRKLYNEIEEPRCELFF